EGLRAKRRPTLALFKPIPHATRPNPSSQGADMAIATSTPATDTRLNLVYQAQEITDRAYTEKRTLTQEEANHWTRLFDAADSAGVSFERERTREANRSTRLQRESGPWNRGIRHGE